LTFADEQRLARIEPPDVEIGEVNEKRKARYIMVLGTMSKRLALSLVLIGGMAAGAAGQVGVQPVDYGWNYSYPGYVPQYCYYDSVYGYVCYPSYGSYPYYPYYFYGSPFFNFRFNRPFFHRFGNERFEHRFRGDFDDHRGFRGEFHRGGFAPQHFGSPQHFGTPQHFGGAHGGMHGGGGRR
jgi:hypothetical protein